MKLVLQKISIMRRLLFILTLAAVGFSSAKMHTQTIESDCDCDVTITSKNQRFPYNNYNESRNKTICFKGNFKYKLNWVNLGNNISMCIGEDVEFESKGLNFEGTKTIYNYGDFDYGQQLELNLDSKLMNYGSLQTKLKFEGGSIKNINGAMLDIEGYSNFNSGYLFNDKSSRINLKQSGYTTLGSNMIFESRGSSEFKGDLDNQGQLTLSGQSEFDKKLINNNRSILSGELIINKGYVSNQINAITEVNANLVIDGDVNLWKGQLEASAGLNFKRNTTVNAEASIKFMGLAKFKNLTLRGEISTDFSCNTLEIKNASGNGGQLTAKESSSITIDKINTLPSSWILFGNVTEDTCNNDNDVVVWLGTKSSDTSDDDNWSSKVKRKSSILIPETDNQPVIDKKLEVFDILIKDQAVLTNTAELELRGNLKAEGHMSSRLGDIYFTGSKLQAINLRSATEIQSLVIDNPEHVELTQGYIDIFNEVKLIQGDLITNHSGHLEEDRLITFKSDSLNTAILSETNQGKIIGNVRIERFLSKSNRAFRYLSSSVNSAFSIKSNWQEGVNNTVNNYDTNKNPHPKYGTHITGSKQGNNGFDATPTGNPSLLTWEINSNSWKAIANTDQSKLQVGKGYSLLVRGDRSTNIYSSNSAYTGSTTLRITGSLAFGDIDMSDELNKTPNGFTLIGNPYQAPVDMKQTLLEGSSQIKKNFYYVWSPALQTRGGYITVDTDSEPVEYIPSALGPETNSNQNYRYIQPNQSVFIETSSTANDGNQPSLIFKETYKSNNSISNEAFGSPEEVGKIDLTLIRNEDDQVVDGVRFKFSDNYQNEINQNDATKVWNNEESFSILSNSQHYLAIEKRQYPQVDESLKFWIGNYTRQTYTMMISQTNLEGYDVFFKDLYTGDSVKLNQADQKIIFTVDSSIAESVASDRFEITFEPITLSTEEGQLENEIRLYPNPSSSGTTYIKHEANLSKDLKIDVYSLTGQKLEVPLNRVSSTELKMNTANLVSGIYLIKLSHQGKTSTRKLVIN